MSAKWVRSKQWDDQHIPAWAWPLRVLLRTFSGIPLAVCLLASVVVYAIMASVPIGLLALAPTYIVYALILGATLVLVAVLPAAGLWGGTRARTSLGVRFPATVLALLALTGLGLWLWVGVIWPMLRYDPVHNTGFRLFPAFVDAYASTTLRRLPGMEMSELEFYAWWPLRVVLILFVINMVTATVRRIEFIFPNLGVLTVHTGIVTIALGSLYYQGLKQEGDTLLVAGASATPDGVPLAGPPQVGFYDNTRVMLWARQDRGDWEQRRLRVPRYNDYGLGAGGGVSAATIIGKGNAAGLDGGRTLDRPVPPARSGSTRLDADVSFRVVGYASYADPAPDYVQAPEPASGKANPLRFVSLRGRAPEGAPGDGPRDSEYAFYFLPDSPAGRLSEFKDDAGNAAFALEYTRQMPEWRWRDLGEALPSNTEHALAIEVPGPTAVAQPYRMVVPVEPGFRARVGDTGYSLEVKQISPTPPLAIITEGYKGSTSSVAQVHITQPDGRGYDRYVYHRFPEISQDLLLDELKPNGMPTRRDADPAIRVTYIDASIFQLYIDEQADGSARVLARLPAGPARDLGRVGAGGTIEEILPRRDPASEPRLDLVLGARWEHAEAVERPRIVPEARRDKAQVGTHEHAMLGVEVSAKDGFKKVVWLPFTKYLGAGMGTERTVVLPGGRQLSLAFGRLLHGFPDFMIQLVDFQMIAYDHRGSPRDYQSIIRVIPTHDGTGPLPFKQYEHVTKLNNPLQAPFEWDDSRPYLSNVAGTLASRLSPRQFKLSQAGWDAEGWKRTQAMADKGELPRPYAGFTILGVGNNPGIHIIAAGAVMVCLGTPWAFYIKPLIMRRRKHKLQQAVASGALSPRRPRTPTTIATEPEPTVAGANP